MYARAKELRGNKTAAEKTLFHVLHKLQEKPVRSQIVIHDMIVDIALPKRDLLIEVDGSIHSRPGGCEHVAIRDKYKNEKLHSLGFNLIRIYNEYVNVSHYIQSLLEQYPESETAQQAFCGKLKEAEKLREIEIQDQIRQSRQYCPDAFSFKFLSRKAIANALQG